MTYKESEKELKALMTENEIIFRCAIFHLIDVGTRFLTDECVENTCAEIMKQDDSHSMMTNEFQCDIVRVAGKIAKYDAAHIIKFASKIINV